MAVSPDTVSIDLSDDIEHGSGHSHKSHDHSHGHSHGNKAHKKKLEIDTKEHGHSHGKKHGGHGTEEHGHSHSKEGAVNHEDEFINSVSAALEEKETYKKNMRMLIIMLVMVFVVFLAELLVGFIGKSLALLSDAFHMFSDFVSLIVGATALRLAQKPRTARLSYGWGRAEILGGLINGVFLICVVLYIYMEAIGRFIEPTIIDQPLMVLIVGIIGLLVNLIGLIMFRGHAHSHGGGGHDHSHGGDDHGHSHKEGEHAHDIEEGASPKPRKAANHNMFGVFLHILGDFLGSIGVIISAGILMIVDGKTNAWVNYIDPAVSVILSTIILFSTIPLVKNCSKILLQSVPEGVELVDVTEKIKNVEGVIDVHDLHIWHLVNTKIVCSLHVKCAVGEDFMKLAAKIQSILHNYGVHSTTIQPEYLNEQEILDVKRNCTLRCDTDGLSGCNEQDWCCKEELPNAPLLSTN